MEGLSATASVIAVGSVAVQLADSVKKLRHFWWSIKNASDDVRAIAGDLQVLSHLLAEINLEAQDQNASMTATLLKCVDGIRPLTIIVEGLEPGFESNSPRTRKWSALKTGLNAKKIRRYQSSLERMKTSLLLAQQSHHGRLSRSQFEVLKLQLDQNIHARSEPNQQSLSGQTSAFSTSLSSKQDHILALSEEILRITSALPKFIHSHGDKKRTEKAFGHIFDELESEASDKDVTLAKKRSSVPQKPIATDSTSENRNPQSQDWMCCIIEERHYVLNYPFGKIYVRSRMSKLQSRYFENKCQYEHETSFTLCPAWWLVKVGFIYIPRLILFNSTIQGWKSTLSSFRLVPDNALIFEYCITGDFSGLQALLARGEASVRDIDSAGRTALHFAAARHRVQICKLLISAGADKCVYDWSNLLTPLLAAADHNDEVIVNFADAIDTIRLFSDSIDFSENHGSGWRTLVHLYWNVFASIPDGISIDDTSGNPLLVWMLRFSASDISENFSKESLSGHDVAEVGKLILTMANMQAHTAFRSGIYSALQCFICYAGAFDEMDFSLRLMLSKRINLHLLRHHTMFGCWSETPTSLALYSSFIFMRWRDALLRSSVDLESFAEDEVQRSPLRDAGWNKDLLLALFRCNIKSDHTTQRPIKCEDCSRPMLRLCVELSWREWLNRFRRKMSIKYPSNGAYSEFERDAGEDNTVEQKPSSLHVEKNPVDEFSDEEEDGVDESATSDTHKPKPNMGDLDTYLRGETRYACMPCYLKRQRHISDI